VYCTGLGAIVASWPARTPRDQHHWVLTDSSLVNGKEALCANRHPLATLTSIEVYLSTAYNNSQGMTFQSTIGSVTCQDGTCHSGMALFALGGSARNQLLPFIDLAQQQPSNQDMAIALTTGAVVPSTSNSNAQPLLPIPSMDVSDAQGAAGFQTQVDKFRTPSAALPTDRLEAGTPLINSHGQLTGLHLEVSPASNNVQTFIQNTIPGFNSHSSNSVHDGWQHGMDAYNKRDFKTAHAQFQMAADANPSFQAAKLLAASSNTSSSNNSKGQSNPTNTITIAGTSIVLWQLVFVIIALLAVLLLAITFLRTRHQRTLKADLHEAHQRARIDAPQIAEMERAKTTQQSLSAQPTQPNPVLIPAQPATTHLPCPRCGKLVPCEANYCSECRLFLALSESGKHLRPEAISNPAVSNRMLVDQPTPPAMPATSISEQPTAEITPNRVRELPIEAEKTGPYTRHQISGTRFKLVVGTRSDVGIKRKYKPNEDSLFAAQGLIDEASTTHPYGLFVIADGMGGHANGQDASRLAIQTIIAYILPRLSQHGPLSNDEYVRLLVEGIQSANQAVHQQNMDQRGDMGTTVTGALIVNNLAYVVNVGDSRTYLYREPDGLKKITNDHSVVASLVEAGIIKPDDIYTHPKRSHIYRSLGEKPNVEVDQFTIELQEGDKLLLCSDGLWDMVRDPKIEDVIKSPAANPSATSDALILAAFEGGGEDNVSVIVIQIEEPATVADMPRIDVLAKPDTVQMPQI
jgi:serine/threonine protein phosphatase PrpC